MTQQRHQGAGRNNRLLGDTSKSDPRLNAPKARARAKAAIRAGAEGRAGDVAGGSCRSNSQPVANQKPYRRAHGPPKRPTDSHLPAHGERSILANGRDRPLAPRSLPQTLRRATSQMTPMTDERSLSTDEELVALRDRAGAFLDDVPRRKHRATVQQEAQDLGADLLQLSLEDPGTVIEEGRHASAARDARLESLPGSVRHLSAPAYAMCPPAPSLSPSAQAHAGAAFASATERQRHALSAAPEEPAPRCARASIGRLTAPVPRPARRLDQRLGAPGRTRTCDPPLGTRALYPAELRTLSRVPICRAEHFAPRRHHARASARSRRRFDDTTASIARGGLDCMPWPLPAYARAAHAGGQRPGRWRARGGGGRRRPASPMPQVDSQSSGVFRASGGQKSRLPSESRWRAVSGRRRPGRGGGGYNGPATGATATGQPPTDPNPTERASASWRDRCTPPFYPLTPAYPLYITRR